MTLSMQNTPLYYRKMFPYQLFYKWLSYGDKNYFEKREFSFTLPGDIYIRYQSFSDSDEFHRALIEKNPVKIDIGAVFKNPPKNSKKNYEIPEALEKELVFDIDMDDYDEIRTCCSGAAMCNKCWRFILIGMEILDSALRQDFGFKHILWVFSGRRGVHGWVCDERARKLSPKARDAIVSYFSIIEGGDGKLKRVNLPSGNLHPMIIRTLDIIDKYFKELLTEQQWLDSKEGVENFINLCTDAKVRKELTEVLEKPVAGPKPIKRWEEYQKHIKRLVERSKSRHICQHLVEEIKLQYCYPRLDVNVTRGLNHLLKAPFCVHPKTQNICIPIDMKGLESFDLEKVPTLDQLCDQIDQIAGKENDGDFTKQTSISQSISIFRKFIRGCESESRHFKADTEELF